MSYFNKYRNRRRPDGGFGGPGMGSNTDNIPSAMGLGMGSPPDVVFDLGKNKRVTVRRFRNVNLIDIREYYVDKNTGDMCPGKKGISLTEDLYDELLKHRLNIDDALRRFGSKRPRTKTIRILSDAEDDDTSSSSSSDNSDNESDKRRKSKNKKKLERGNDRGKDKDSSRDRDSSRRTDSKNNNRQDVSGGSGSGSGDKEERKIKPVLKRERETEMVDGEEIEIQPRKQKVAPPTLLPHEENIENAKREANATLIIPGANKAQSGGDNKTATATRGTDRSKHDRTQSIPDHDPNSSDGGSIEAEMNKILNEPSDEEF